MKYPKQNRPIPPGMIGFNGFNLPTNKSNLFQRKLSYFIDFSCLHGVRFLNNKFTTADR